MLKKRYVLFSMIVHSLFLIPFLLKELKSQPEGQEEQKKGTGAQIQAIEIQPIDLTDSIEANKPKKEELKFYWGIGISTAEEYRSIIPYGRVIGYNIARVHSGYTAENVGLSPGDFIFLINGKPIDRDNDIKGESYRKLLLTVQKNNGQIITIQTERCKVLY